MIIEGKGGGEGKKNWGEKSGDEEKKDEGRR